MKTKYTVLLAALAASLFGVPAIAASTSSSTSGSSATGISTSNNAGIGNSSAGSNSGASAGSMAVGGNSSSTTGYTGADATITINNPAGDPAGDPTSTENLVTTGTQRIITTGAAIAPSIYSNNVCALSASAAGGFLGGAFALGFDRVDKGCDHRATAALLGHFSEIYSIAAAHAPDATTRQLAEREAVIYAQWANNYMCMQDPDLAAAAPPGANVCKTVATQQGMQVVPSPVATYVAPAPQITQPVVAAAPRQIAAIDPPPQKPVYTGPHIYGQHEGGVPSSWHTGPISGYQGPDYTDDE